MTAIKIKETYLIRESFGVPQLTVKTETDQWFTLSYNSAGLVLWEKINDPFLKQLNTRE
jgi:hypothetical protein